MSAWFRLGSALSQEMGTYIGKNTKYFLRWWNINVLTRMYGWERLMLGGKSFHRSLTFKPDLPENQSWKWDPNVTSVLVWICFSILWALKPVKYVIKFTISVQCFFGFVRDFLGLFFLFVCFLFLLFWIFLCQSKEIIVVTTELCLCLSKSGIKLMQVECTFWNQFWTFSLLLFVFTWLKQNIYQSGS